MIGLSLSFCIRDIIEGKVHPFDVDKIYTGTLATNEREWRHLIKNYQQLCWQADPRRAKQIVQRMRHEGKIVQLRKIGLIPVYNYDGNDHWVETGDRFRVSLHWEERR